MFVGHFAVGFFSKRFAPQTSLAPLIAAPLFLDILWPIFILLGIEHARIVPGITAASPLDLYDYPYSHSLLLAAVWSLAAGFAAYFALGRRPLVSVVIAIGVFSHWILDWISHIPDLPLYPGSSIKVGLGLWNSVAATVAVEGVLYVASLAVYARSTRPRNRGGSIGFWAFAGLLAVLYVVSFVAPPPPSTTAIGITAIVSTVLFLAWITWFDRRREAQVTA